ncbi:MULTISPECIES: hypothetical protein [Fischerella]|uniref:hypothetical protein n=1 Tax=Fischerella TaxID=1190 RepID=UPI000783FC6F|nr:MULTISPECIES: hypothetical protein [Fischerella]BCX06588.1 MAG: hypothetical protein KatS3mg066_0447 [Fischerella sp.]
MLTLTLTETPYCVREAEVGCGVYAVATTGQTPKLVLLMVHYYPRQTHYCGNPQAKRCSFWPTNFPSPTEAAVGVPDP